MVELHQSTPVCNSIYRVDAELTDQTGLDQTTATLAEYVFQASTPIGIQTVFLISWPVGILVTFVGQLVLDSL